MTNQPKLRVISLGAGVQSTTMALMAAKGEISPTPDCAIFADTGWEPKAVYRWIEWLRGELPFPILIAKRPGMDLGELSIAIAHSPDVTKSAMPPYYTANPNGMIPRQCSKEFKSRVVGREIRKMLFKGDKAEQWMGISTDEIQRMKDAEFAFLKNRFPLIEANMSRRDYLGWMERNGYPKPPKSACIFCPFHTNAEWRQILASEDKDRLVYFDANIRPGFHGMKGEAYLHRQRVPIDQVDLSTAADRGQVEFGFLQECDGVCGI